MVECTCCINFIVMWCFLHEFQENVFCFLVYELISLPILELDTAHTSHGDVGLVWKLPECDSFQLIDTLHAVTVQYAAVDPPPSIFIYWGFHIISSSRLPAMLCHWSRTPPPPGLVKGVEQMEIRPLQSNLEPRPDILPQFVTFDFLCLTSTYTFPHDSCAEEPQGSNVEQ